MITVSTVVISDVESAVKLADVAASDSDLFTVSIRDAAVPRPIAGYVSRIAVADVAYLSYSRSCLHETPSRALIVGRERAYAVGPNYHPMHVVDSTCDDISDVADSYSYQGLSYIIHVDQRPGTSAWIAAAVDVYDAAVTGQDVIICPSYPTLAVIFYQDRTRQTCDQLSRTDLSC